MVRILPLLLFVVVCCYGARAEDGSAGGRLGLCAVSLLRVSRHSER